MNRKLLIFTVVFLSLAGFVGYMIFGSGKLATLGGDQVLSGEVEMLIGEDEYTPGNIKITKGTKVTFKNGSESLRWPASDLHPSHGVYSEFDPKAFVKPGESWSFTFDKAGEWGYHDHLAPYITGTITVIE
jgi:plastocyanin